MYFNLIRIRFLTYNLSRLLLYSKVYKSVVIIWALEMILFQKNYMPKNSTHMILTTMGRNRLRNLCNRQLYVYYINKYWCLAKPNSNLFQIIKR